MSKNTEEMLRNTRPRDLSQEETSLMWSKVEHGIAIKKSPLQLPIVSIIKRFVLTPLLALSLLGGGTVAFADNARPGDFLFPLDELAEQVHIALSTTDRRAELRVEFAEERFEEAQELLSEFAARAGIAIEMTASQATGAATSTSETATSTSETGTAATTMATSTDNGSNDSSSDDNSNTSNDTSSESSTSSNNSDDDEAISNLSQALSYLEETRAKLIAEGNDHAVPAIDRIIEDLARLMENELGTFHSARVFAKSDGDEVKLSVKTKTDNGRTDFTFKKDGEEEEINIKVNEDGVKTSLRMDEDEGFFSFVFNNKNKSKSDDSDHDEDEDEDDDDKKEKREKKEKNKWETICHVTGSSYYPEHTLRIPESAVKAHLKHGDYRGRCGDEDEDDDDNTDTTSPTIIDLAHSAGTTTAEISWSTDENANGTLWVATTTPVDTDTNPTASETSIAQDHVFALTGLTASTTYYYVVSSSDESGNTATSSEASFETLSDEVPEPEDTTPPVLSDITAENIATTTADITWSTDEDADSTVWYDTQTPIDLGSAANETSSASTTVHNLPLSGLTASSTYYYIVVSTDEAGNTATSSEKLFDTLAPEPSDTLPPVIANISVSNLASTTATINWDTNEDADGKLWYSDTSPIALDTDPQELSATLETTHLFDLAGLAASTTYYYVISSTDEADNTATSTEQTFITL